MAGMKPTLRIIDYQSTPHAAQIIDENGVDWAKYCRKAVITLDAGEINSAVLEMVGPAVDVIAELKEVRVVIVCEKCADETQVEDITTLPDRVRHYARAVSG